jgi:predicted flap endonuclease-1-like 5' DNA nuclease
MLSLTYVAAALLALGLVAGGALAAWARFRVRVGTAWVPIAAHRDEVMRLRRRYRQRLRALRDAGARSRAGEADARRELRAAADHHLTQERLLAGARAETEALRRRLAEVDAACTAHREEIAVLRARAASAAAELAEARARIAASEQDHGLLRIERDELAARTERLRALALPAPAEAGEEAPAPGAARAELADRDARIHELECALAEREGRVAELESSLATWKYRIAPIALHMERQRERKARAVAAAAAPRDDLKRIRGIGRGLEKKLHAAGITGFAQLAALAPAELANLAVRLGLAASRPQRDRWAGQAAALAAPATAGTPAADGPGLHAGAG